MFKNKIILITGGTGSFGSAFVNHCLEKKLYFKEIRILSRDEKKQDDFRKKLNNKKVKFYIGDVKDKSSLGVAFKNVDFVFHAAAYKQVPSCEFYPMEAIKTNVIGTNNVIDIAMDEKVEKVVCLSTDKAVYPINAMGISKAMMEKVAISKSLNNQNSTTICVTRYGNVLASRGSVIPLMINQIRKNKPITITDGEMTRFLMPMSEAINLVIYAMKNAKNGDIFVKKTYSSTIKSLVNSIIKFMNKKKWEVKIIGNRHGEKKHECLLSSEELSKAQDLKNFYRIPSDIRDLNYNNYFDTGKPKDLLKVYSSDNVKILNENELLKILKSIKKELLF
ncbi:polysaccharide biosynthesis protein [Candidatus Pelagibacter sp.]|uniref:polysaccharide biosynthesis protein n=1 Tax=Candidatus Pelagibacter sp. TaxID=2024849 RepID=UPI003F83A057